MESLSFSLEGRELPLSADVELHVSRNLLLSDAFHGTESMDSGLIDMPEVSIAATQCVEHLVDDTNVGSNEYLLCIPTVTPNSSLEISSSFPNSVVRNHLENMQSRESKRNDRLFVEKSLPAKRARVENCPSLIPVCVVLGCNKDLSSLKEYHKKHKVCDVHSKTSVVIVNGIQQRFCQQCSRFHILAEFDEGKRSCRKRLADHNERRRKPQLDSRFGSMSFKAGFFTWQSNEPTNHFIPLELQKEATQISKSVAVPQAFGKQYSYMNKLYPPLLAVELSGSYSSSAHSLLSAQPQSSLTNSEITSTSHFPIFQQFKNADFTSTQKANKCHKTRIPDTGTSNLKGCHNLSPEGTNTVDLLQLSLHLQRIQEQQKSSAPNNVFG